ncbi:hypothetical protein M427DRAFT_51582 [Gonapodya prolifera JEL478]|uniref:Uncharacterized protein n=1 Tax=Gonapodya prolifera (strain JEL478) TaxID=1344416 RepID=A0A139AY31_GONPJ|nr:hypothetical protein M427DRAFT_51582 [Gonapodya prolifera JEL478]|eukprot:KXS21355.1 hypothetical protein M427DRAFT_51582 [Gonapodya prolifera JEL478]
MPSTVKLKSVLHQLSQVVHATGGEAVQMVIPDPQDIPSLINDTKDVAEIALKATDDEHQQQQQAAPKITRPASPLIVHRALSSDRRGSGSGLGRARGISPTPPKTHSRTASSDGRLPVRAKLDVPRPNPPTGTSDIVDLLAPMPVPVPNIRGRARSRDDTNRSATVPAPSSSSSGRSVSLDPSVLSRLVFDNRIKQGRPVLALETEDDSVLAVRIGVEGGAGDGEGDRSRAYI